MLILSINTSYFYGLHCRGAAIFFFSREKQKVKDTKLL